ncbi:magnesium chelatase subunit D family protein [Alkalibaculum bacchi]|uniref:magnesium chelatase subunit D family protein n=1 Tax=Alkalibaculum bacchi TaxID=645887 RepID=UPI0026EE8C50|nr:magnesium chelatase subunit D family protein [Alkalibaculum bacchi]
MFNRNSVFPFVGVLGQDAVKNALIWNVINPRIGGVLICGEKGTAKSTLVRGFEAVLEGQTIVQLPLNVTEDRLVGTIDFEHAIKYGDKKFEPGILHRADKNILYVDEVNLLSDHLVKILLESASSGINIVEREGISFKHTSDFILVGSMNPEEGALRPQFLDRFGLYVEVKGEKDLRKRCEIIRRRISFEEDPLSYVSKWMEETRTLSNKVKRAKEDLLRVTVTQNAMQLASSIVKEGNCEGHRGELVLIETAKAIAAFSGRTVINIEDIKEAAKYALPHRIRNNQPQQQTSMPTEQDGDKDNQQEDNKNKPNDQLDQQEQSSDTSQDQGEFKQQSDPSQMDNYGDESTESQEEEIGEGNKETVDDPGQPFIVNKWLEENVNRTVVRGSGKRSRVVTSSNQGRYVRYAFPKGNKITDVALDATLRSAAPYQLFREKGKTAIAIEKSDIRVKVREKRSGNTIVFVVDASGSMGANKRMTAVKGAILSLLNDAYQKRDRVCMIAFRNDSAELMLGVTRSVDLAQKKLSVLPTGGRTPLAAGLDMAYDVIKGAKIKDKDILPAIVLVTDGRATYVRNGIDAFEDAMRSAQRIGTEKIKTVLIDTDQNFIQLNLGEKIATALNADRYKIEDLKAQDLVTAVSQCI